MIANSQAGQTRQISGVTHQPHYPGPRLTQSPPCPRPEHSLHSVASALQLWDTTHQTKMPRKRCRGPKQWEKNVPGALMHKDASLNSVFPSPITWWVAAALEHMTQCTKELQKAEKNKTLGANLREKQALLKIKTFHDTVFKTSQNQISTVTCLSKGTYIKIPAKIKKRMVKPISIMK